MITMDELIAKLSAKGYPVTKTMLSYYIRKALLPSPQKMGVRRGGVKNVYPDENAIIARVEMIFALKEKGKSLGEILQELDLDALKRGQDNARKQLKRYIQKNGRYYRRLSKEEFNGHYRTARDLNDFNEILYEESGYLVIDGERVGGMRFTERYLAQIHDLGLFEPVYLYRNKYAYEVSGRGYESIRGWCFLHSEMHIDWKTLAAVRRKHAQNLDRHLFYPQPNGVQSSEAFNGWQRQQLLNDVSIRLRAYCISMRRGFLPSKLEEDPDDPPELAWDAKYSDVDTLIKDFLAGTCAFVPVLTVDPGDESEIGLRLCLRRF